MKSDSSISTLLLDQLSRNSMPYQDPLTRVHWDSLNTSHFWLPETALSLYGVPEFMASPLEQRMRLSQYEFLHLLELGLWLEGLFIMQLCQGLRRQPGSASSDVYHLHELREEVGHSLLFMTLMQRCGLERPGFDARRLRGLDFIGRHASMNSLLFWALTLMAEEIPDRMNRLIIRHGQSLNPAIVEIARLHTIDESRHITHAKNRLALMLNASGYLKKWTARRVLPPLFRRFVRTVYFPSHTIYECAGLMPGHSWAEIAWQNPHRHQFIAQQLESGLRVLKDQGIALHWKQ